MKLMLWWFLLSCIMAGLFLQELRREYGFRGVLVAVLIAASLTASGVAAVYREMQLSWRMFPSEDLALTDFVKLHTSKEAIFLTSDKSAEAFAMGSKRSTYDLGTSSFRLLPSRRRNVFRKTQTSDSFRDSFRCLRDDAATEAVTQQNNVTERIVHHVIHDRLCALRMVHILVNSFSVACDRRSKCLVSFAFEVLDSRLPGCPIVPGTMHQDERRHQILLIHFGISQKTFLR
jgi:hypothetical protein